MKRFLPNWMRPTGRDRFNLEKMRIHTENFFFYYQESLRPIVELYVSRSIFQSHDYFYRILVHMCHTYCQQVYIPFDDDTRPFFESFSQRIVQVKSTGRRFLSTSLDFELTALVLIIVLILLRSICDPLLDEFLTNYSPKTSMLFSYSVWMKHLHALIELESIRDYQFFGRTSILVNTTTDNHSKMRYMKSFSKVFNRHIQSTHDQQLEQINKHIHDIRQALSKNCVQGSLIYAMKAEEFFRREFPVYSSGKCHRLGHSHTVGTH
jgi:hypothetical protein